MASLLLLFLGQAFGDEPPLRIAVFEADVTPPLGTPLCDGLVFPAKTIDDKLLARGIVLFPTGKPIVLCSLDWVGVGNGGHRAFRKALAEAAVTDVERVCVHCTHAHDAPGCDFDADDLLARHGLGGQLFDPVFAREAIRRTAAAVKAAASTPRTVTHIGVGKARVHEVASARRVMGADGKVKYIRFSKTSDPKVRAEPEGLIDPFVQTLAFFDKDAPVAVLTYYATHPQSHYGKGAVSCDFPGIARTLRDQVMPGVMHVHFNGAGGNVTAGKYNDGAPANRMVLAHRLADGMKRAYESLKKEPIDAGAASWKTAKARLPLSKSYSTKELTPKIADASLPRLE